MPLEALQNSAADGQGAHPFAFGRNKLFEELGLYRSDPLADANPFTKCNSWPSAQPQQQSETQKSSLKSAGEPVHASVSFGDAYSSCKGHADATTAGGEYDRQISRADGDKSMWVSADLPGKREGTSSPAISPMWSSFEAPIGAAGTIGGAV